MGYLKGRINRALYWGLIAVLVVLYGIVAALGLPPRVSEVVLVIVGVPRLHDLGKTGWWMLLLVPWEAAQIATLWLAPETSILALGGLNLLGLAALIGLGVARGQRVANRFGEPPGPGLGIKRAES